MKLKAWTLVFFLMLFVIHTFAQVVDISDQPTELQSESIEPTEEVIYIELPPILFGATTSSSFFAPAYQFVPNPQRAVLFSAIFPGLGQAYNRQFWKIPLVFTGFAAFTYSISWFSGHFRDYQNAFVDIRSGNPEATRWHYFVPFTMNPNEIDKVWFANVLEHRRDFNRHWRDLNIILTVGFYLITMVDAYVDARLFNFTMSQDLSMRIEPTMISHINNSPNNNFFNSAHGLQWSFRF